MSNTAKLSLRGGSSTDYFSWEVPLPDDNKLHHVTIKATVLRKGNTISIGAQGSPCIMELDGKEVKRIEV